MLSKRLIVCLDSNIYVSALGFGGKPLAVVELALKKAVLLVTSEHILNEVRTNLTKKLGIKAAEIEHFLEHVIDAATLFTPTGSTVEGPPLSVFWTGVVFSKRTLLPPVTITWDATNVVPAVKQLIVRFRPRELNMTWHSICTQSAWRQECV